MVEQRSPKIFDVSPILAGRVKIIKREVEYMFLFDQTVKAMQNFEKLQQNKPKTRDEEFKCDCAPLDISKAIVYDIGYDQACKIAKGILALYEIHS